MDLGAVIQIEDCLVEVAFLNGRKGGDTCHDSDWNNGPENCRNKEEEQKACQFVGFGVREAEAFADNQCRDLIDNLNEDNQTCPNPQPCRNPKDGQ